MRSYSLDAIWSIKQYSFLVPTIKRLEMEKKSSYLLLPADDDAEQKPSFSYRLSTFFCKKLQIIREKKQNKGNMKKKNTGDGDDEEEET